MITCWVIYTYTNKLSGNMAMKFTGDTYKEIEEQAKEWFLSSDDIKVIDIAESMEECDDEDYDSMFE